MAMASISLIEAPRGSDSLAQRIDRPSAGSPRWVRNNKDERILAAQLLDDDGQPVRKRTVAFNDDFEKQASINAQASNDAGGIARCKIRSRVVGKPIISMVFSGDAYYEPASL